MDQSKGERHSTVFAPRLEMGWGPFYDWHNHTLSGTIEETWAFHPEWFLLALFHYFFWRWPLGALAFHFPWILERPTLPRGELRGRCPLKSELSECCQILSGNMIPSLPRIEKQKIGQGEATNLTCTSIHLELS